MDDDCPWKEYENFSSEVFIKENFKLLSKYCNIFEETLPYVCKEIVFLKVYMEFFKIDIWITVYELNHPQYDELYLIAGEPKYDIEMSEMIKNRTGLENYPDWLIALWSIHSFWFCVSDISSNLDYILRTGFPRFTDDGMIPHVNSLNISEYNSFIEKDYIDINIQDESDIYDEEDRKRIYVPQEYNELGLDAYIEEYLKRAIYSHDINGDGVYFVPSSANQVNILWHGYNDTSTFYNGLCKYLLMSPLGGIEKVNDVKDNLVKKNIKKYLEYKDNKRDRFWQIELDDNTFTITFGNVGEEGEVRLSQFKNSERALLQAEKFIEKKLANGYVEVQKSLKEDKIETKRESKAKIKNGEINYYEELVKFDKEYGEEAYAEEFWIVDDKDDFFEYWLALEDKEKMKEYSQSVKVFASADGTGARYAFWFADGNTDRNKAPIIYYGSEGEIVLVAENIKDLIKMLSYGCECMDGSFYHGIYEEDYEDYDNFLAYFITYIPNILSFRKWMKDTLGIKPVSIKNLENNEEGESKEIEKLQKKAKKKYQKSFDIWQHQFYPSEEDINKEYYDKQQTLYEKTKAELLAEIAKKPTGDLYLKLSENEMILEKVNHDQVNLYLEKGLKIEPNYIDILKKYAEKVRYSNPEKAIELYTKLIEIHPEPKGFYSDVAFAFNENDDLENALEYYKKDIIANPDSYGTYSQDYLVEICEKLKKQAITILEETLKKSANKGTYKVLYKQYFKKKKYEKSLENVLKYIEHSDEQAHNYSNIAERFFKKECYVEAEQIYRKSLERETWDDRKMHLCNNIALCILRIKPVNIDKALEVLKEGYKFNNTELAVHANIQLCGMLYYRAKEYDKATTTLKFCLNNFDYQTEKTKTVLKEIEKIVK